MEKTLTLKNLRVWPGNGHEFNYRDISIKNGIIVNTPVKHARIYNMEGYWAVPGFTDSHVHLVAYAISESRLRLDGMDLETIQNKVKIAVEQFSDGSWIRGRGWEAAHRVQGGFPHRREIDHLTENHPLAISSKDGHSLWLNTCALSKLNIPADISDPPGGRYDRGSEGELTGVIREKAVDAIISMLPSESDHEKRRLLKDAVRRLNRHGIVAVHSFEGLKEFNLL
ncbi:amidohydrolase family protein, partial [bacterium]|nr:amidohydrolase family protein [bacterium]